MQCPYCQSSSVVKNGKYMRSYGSEIQHHLCKACGKRFSGKTGTPMAGLRTAPEVVAIAIKMRGEGMGVRASGRVLEKSHATILRWEKRVAAQAPGWSPNAPADSEVTLESDEVYTRYAVNLPPSESLGWTLTSVERDSRYWVTAVVRQKDETLFAQGVQTSWQWAEPAQFIRW